MTHPLLVGLNEQQQRAVQAVDGPVLVLAGPGSGKTRVLTHRIAYLISELGTKPYNILAVTFTNKAAREMRDRLITLIGESAARDVMMGTFHSICARWLRRDIEHLGRSRDFVVYDADDQQRLMRQVLKDLDLDEKQYPPRTIHARISSAKNEMLSPSEYAQYANSYYEEIVTRCYERYEKKLLANNALDFDDLLLKAVHVLELNPAVLSHYQDRYVHVMVDEVQDTNRVQYALINLVGAKYNNYFLIGDIQQSIYAWRGARLANVREFEAAHPDVQIVPLEQNYRSTQPILDVAQAVIDAATERRHTTRIWSDRIEGIQAKVVEAYDGDEEARWVADEIQRLQSTANHSLDDFAVMYRTNAQSRALEEALISRALRYKLVGGTRFYERKEIKDILAYLRIIHNPHDEVSLLRVINTPGRGIGDKTQQDALNWAREMDVSLYTALHLLIEGEEIKAPFAARARSTLASFVKLIAGQREQRHDVMLSELLSTLLDRLNYKAALAAEHGEEESETRWENVLELLNVTAEYAGLQIDQQLPTFLEEVALVADVDSLDGPREREPGVTLITLHQAKGLEYPVVFLVGLEEGLLPHSRSTGDQESLEEERRLLYVGATRAKERLYLLYAFRRTMWGRTDANSPSRFLADIPDHLLQRTLTRDVKVVTPASHPPLFGRSGGRGSTGRGQGSQMGWSSLQSGTPAKRERPPRPAVESQFSAGQKVRHAMFGDGVVISSTVVGDDEEVTVAFPGKGVKKLLAAFAKLEHVQEFGMVRKCHVRVIHAREISEFRIPGIGERDWNEGTRVSPEWVAFAIMYRDGRRVMRRLMILSVVLGLAGCGGEQATAPPTVGPTALAQNNPTAVGPTAAPTELPTATEGPTNTPTPVRTAAPTPSPLPTQIVAPEITSAPVQLDTPALSESNAPATPKPEPKPNPKTNGNQPVRLVINGIGVDQEPVSVGLDSRNLPVVPKHAVGWYNLSARPGQGENVVFWGHVLRWMDSPKVPAPFARLQEAGVGTPLTVYTADGTAHQYAVTQQVWATPDQVQYILPVGSERITLVSCIGDRVIRDGAVGLTHRLITIAEPVR